jgi:addiction module HigA family antidote
MANIPSGSISSGASAFAGQAAEQKRSKSVTITDSQALLPNPSPGDILWNEFLLPLNMSQSALARALGVPPRRINEIILGKRIVTADTDLRLCRYWGLSDGYWLRLQAAFDLMQQKRRMGAILDRIVPFEAA